MDAGFRRPRSRLVIGGFPFRILRLSSPGSALLDDLAAGLPVPPTRPAQALARRLLGADLAHPRPGPAPFGGEAVTAVVPVRDRPAGLAATLRALGPAGTTIVVDDGSDPPVDAGPDVIVVCQPRPAGPAAARNRGWQEAGTEVVAFVDADCQPSAGWLSDLLPYFADPAVGAVAPRIVASGGTAPWWLQRYEHARSPLDLGPRPANVRPDGRVTYVPTATLLVRRRALAEIGGFDAGLRVGEDVDLIWRLASTGWQVRYVPTTTVGHPARPGPATWLRQRFDYGTSAGPLARRHGAAVAPLVVSRSQLATWGLAAAGWPLAALATAGLGAAATVRRLVRPAAVAPSAAGSPTAGPPALGPPTAGPPALGPSTAGPPALGPKGTESGGKRQWTKGASEEPALARPQPAPGVPLRDAAELVIRGQLAGARGAATAVRRAWWPLLLVVSLRSHRARRALAAAYTLPYLVEWVQERPGFDPLRWCALRTADDTAYSVGVWVGSWRARTVRALLPRVR